MKKCYNCFRVIKKNTPRCITCNKYACLLCISKNIGVSYFVGTKPFDASNIYDYYNFSTKCIKHNNNLYLYTYECNICEILALYKYNIDRINNEINNEINIDVLRDNINNIINNIKNNAITERRSLRYVINKYRVGHLNYTYDDNDIDEFDSDNFDINNYDFIYSN